MYKFPNLRLSHAGTLTGRFSSSLPVPTYSYTPKSGWFKHQQQLIDQSKFWDALLKIDYAAIESKMLKKLALEELGTKFHISAMRPPVKPITIMEKPIEITELETFRVEISVPPQLYADFLALEFDPTFASPGLSGYGMLDGFDTLNAHRQEIQPCQCEMQILMSVGCRCGGA
jgi:hypothetical protein